MKNILNKVANIALTVISVSKTLILGTLNFLGLLTPYNQLSTDTVLLVGVVIKFLTVPDPNFADIPAIIALIASRVHKRQVASKGDKERLEKEKANSAKEIAVLNEKVKQLETQTKSLENETVASNQNKQKMGVWGR
jgi:hypothetical protein